MNADRLLTASALASVAALIGLLCWLLVEGTA